MRYRIVVAVAAAVLLMGEVGFAQAQGRTDKTQTSGTLSLPLGSCDTFDIWQSFSYDWVMKTRVDKGGKPVQYINTFTYYDSYYYNPAIDDWLASGRYLVGKAEHNTTRQVGDIYYNSGPYNRVIIPGEGPVLLWTGHSAFNSVTGALSFAHGPAQVLEGDFAAICRALARR